MSQATIQFEPFEQSEEVTWQDLDPAWDSETQKAAILLRVICGDGPFWVGFFEPTPWLGTLPRPHPQLLYLIDRKGQFISPFGDRRPISGIYFKKVRQSCENAARQPN